MVRHISRRDSKTEGLGPNLPGAGKTALRALKRCTLKMRPRRVLMVHPSAELYGSDRVFLESVQGLMDAGADVIVALPSFGPLVSELKGRGAEVILCKTLVLRRSLLSPSGLLKLLPSGATATVRSLALLLKLRPETVYVNTMTLPLWSILPRFVGCKVVVHVHEAEQSERIVIKQALAAPLLFSTKILINSNFSKTVLLAAQPRLRERVFLIDNPVPGPIELSPPRPQVQGPVRLLYVGRLAQRKGVDIALEALAELIRRGIEAQLDVVGAVYKGNEAYEARLRSIIRDSDLSNLVKLHGFHSDIWPFLSKSDISLVPSRLDESFGNTAVESLLAGRPVVVSDISGLREAAGGYASVEFVPPTSPKAIADAVEKIIGDWNLYRDRSITDAAAAAAKHGPELYQKRLVAQILPARVDLLPENTGASRP